MNDTLDDVLTRLDGVKETGRGYMARCPAHDDSDPSLLVTTGDSVDVTVWCFAGCSWRQVAEAIGIPPAQLSGAEMVDCPECGAAQGAKLDGGEGDTGLWCCYECTEGGTGAQLYAAQNDVSISKAIDEVQSGEALDTRVKRKEKQAPRPRVPEKSDAAWKELHRAYSAMSKEEIWLRDQYRRRRAMAVAERDRDAFDCWHGKWVALHRHVLRREMAAHREADRADANVPTDEYERA